MILFCVIPDEQNETVRLSATIQEEWISRIAEGDMQALEKLKKDLQYPKKEILCLPEASEAAERRAA